MNFLARPAAAALFEMVIDEREQNDPLCVFLYFILRVSVFCEPKKKKTCKKNCLCRLLSEVETFVTFFMAIHPQRRGTHTHNNKG